MIEIHDNVIRPDLANELEQYAFSSSTPWNIDNYATVNTEDNGKFLDPNIVEFVQFRISVKFQGEIINPRAYELTNKFLRQVGRTGHTFAEPYRIKFNLLPRVEKFKDLQYNTPHIDSNLDHYVVLYYLNDCDGLTYIFEQTSDKVPWEKANRIKQYKIKEIIEPKKGRFVIFDGKYYHTSSHPVNSPLRAVININIEKSLSMINK
jgi:hypothetical protein